MMIKQEYNKYLLVPPVLVAASCLLSRMCVIKCTAPAHHQLLLSVMSDTHL